MMKSQILAQRILEDRKIGEHPLALVFSAVRFAGMARQDVPLSPGTTSGFRTEYTNMR